MWENFIGGMRYVISDSVCSSTLTIRNNTCITFKRAFGLLFNIWEQFTNIVCNVLYVLVGYINSIIISWKVQ